MKRLSRYIYNAETLLYEKHEESASVRVLKILGFVAAVAALVCLYFWLYTSVFGLDLPKTAHLKKENAKWRARYEMLGHQMDLRERTLNGIEQRDDDVYRSILGLEAIPEEVKQAGFGGANRYAYLEDLGGDELLKKTVKRLDVLTKRAYIQSKALDEVVTVSKQVAEMKACVPAVPPICPEKGKYRVSSNYGRRYDPINRSKIAFHDGIDFATGKVGYPVYTTGDGVVEKVRYQFFGYGNEIVIDHGFGYKTRYAHLHSINVSKGQVLKRGQLIGEVGNTGKSTGPHLHYEVLFKNKPVDPMAFMDLSMKPEEYKAMVSSVNVQ